MRNWIKRLIHPPHLLRIEELSRRTDVAERNLDGIIAMFPGEDQWLIRKCMKDSMESPETKCHKNGNHYNKNGSVA